MARRDGWDVPCCGWSSWVGFEVKNMARIQVKSGLGVVCEGAVMGHLHGGHCSWSLLDSWGPVSPRLG